MTQVGLRFGYFPTFEEVYINIYFLSGDDNPLRPMMSCVASQTYEGEEIKVKGKIITQTLTFNYTYHKRLLATFQVFSLMLLPPNNKWFRSSG